MPHFIPYLYVRASPTIIDQLHPRYPHDLIVEHDTHCYSMTIHDYDNQLSGVSSSHSSVIFKLSICGAVVFKMALWAQDVLGQQSDVALTCLVVSKSLHLNVARSFSFNLSIGPLGHGWHFTLGCILDDTKMQRWPAELGIPPKGFP